MRKQAELLRNCCKSVAKALVDRHAALYEFDQAFQHSVGALGKAQKQLERQKGQEAKPKQKRGRGRKAAAQEPSEEDLKETEELLEGTSLAVEEQFAQRQQIDR